MRLSLFVLGVPAGLALLAFSSAALADPTSSGSPPSPAVASRPVQAPRPASAVPAVKPVTTGAAPKKAEPTIIDVEARVVSITTEPVRPPPRVVRVHSGDFSQIPLHADGRSPTIHTTASGERFLISPGWPGASTRSAPPATAASPAAPAKLPASQAPRAIPASTPKPALAAPARPNAVALPAPPRR